MFSLQQLFTKDPGFFDLLEDSAREVCTCSAALTTVLSQPEQSAHMSDLRQARQKTKRITEKISLLVVRTFVTVLDREDLEGLAAALYKIPKPIEKFAERFLISRHLIKDGLFAKQDQLVSKATATVLEMVQALKNGMNMEKMRTLNQQLQSIEAEADKLENDLLRDLYSAHSEPVRVLVTKDLYDLLEKVIDRARDAGNVMMHICHKYS